MPSPGTTPARGYGRRHQQLRAALLPDAYGTPCTRCGRVMAEGQDLHLDHGDDRTTYRGFAHAACNTSAGGRTSAARRRRTAPTLNLVTSRDW